MPAGFTPPGGTAPAGGAPAGGRGGPGGGFTAGQIASIDGSTVTVTTRAGSTVKVTTDASTTVQVTKQIALSDLAVGDTVRVVGTVDGSTVAAQSIQRGALTGGFGFGFGGGPPPQGSAPNGAGDPSCADDGRLTTPFRT